MSSITRVPHTTTWDYLNGCLADRFIRSPKVVKEEIMTDVSNLVQEFWTTSSDGAVEESFKFFAMRRLLEILQRCFHSLEVRFDIISFLRLLSTFLIKIYRSLNRLKTESAWETNSRYCLMGIER